MYYCRSERKYGIYLRAGTVVVGEEVAMQAAGTMSSCPAKIRLASATEGLAAARHGQLDARPKLALARDHNVSPRWTLMIRTRRRVSLREVTVAPAGRDSSEPARSPSGPESVGFAERSSRQRLPRPRFTRAIFQSESPGATRMVRTDGTADGATGEAAGARSARAGEAETEAETRGAGAGRSILPGAVGLTGENSKGAEGWCEPEAIGAAGFAAAKIPAGAAGEFARRDFKMTNGCAR